MISPPKMAVSLLLVGMNGNGKSSTGNSILGKKVFTPRGSNASGKEEILAGSSIIDDKEIRVVEGPGIGETNVNDPEDVKLTLSHVKDAMLLGAGGFNAVIFLLRYGVRFTKQEKDTLSMIKAIFGENVIKDYCVIAMSFGDTFDSDRAENNMSFELWCENQKGDVKNLFDECGHRYVLFNNKSTDQWALRIQRDMLLSIVDKLQPINGPYSLNDYDKAEPGRRRLLVSSKLQLLEEENQKVVDNINENLSHIDVYGNPEIAITRLKDLQRKLDRHKSYLQDEAQGTDVMKPLQVTVGVLDTNLKTKLNAASLSRELLKEQNRQRSPPVSESTSITMGDVANNRGRPNTNFCNRLCLCLRYFCQSIFGKSR